MAKPVPIKQCLAKAKEAHARSHMLWRHVNGVIVRVLSSKRSRRWMIDRLRQIAGPKVKNEPVSLCNFRGAANQLERGEEICLL